MKNCLIGCCPKGIPIQYNVSERNIETVFIFSESGNLLQNQTYRCPITPSPESWTSWKKTCFEKESILIDEAFLYYSFHYQVSFAHYLTQTLPLLVDFFKCPSTVKLVVPNHTHTQLQKDLFTLLHIPTDRIQLLKEDQLYKIRYLYPRKQYETPPSPFTQDHIWIFKECRKGFAIPDKPTTRRVYLQRDGRSNPATNNSEAGILRQIKNESVLVRMLQDEFQFEVIQMGNKSVYEKAEALAGIDLLITPLGANCMNLVFGQAPNKVLLLSNATPIGHDYYIPLASAVNSQAIPFDTFLYPVIEHSDPTNQWNGSFIVDVHQIREWIKRNLLQDTL